MRRFSAWLLLLPFLIAAACTPTAPPTPVLPEGISAVTPPHTLTDFVLTRQDGTVFHLHDLQGKYVLMAFGYTHCPDVCPLTLAHMRLVKNLLGEDAAQVEFVFISVDGARDTPQVLGQYLGYFNAGFIGLTGDESTLRSVISEFNGIFTLNNAGGVIQNYTVDHTALKFLLDPEGRWVRTYAYNLDPQLIADDLQSVIGS